MLTTMKKLVYKLIYLGVFAIVALGGIGRSIAKGCETCGVTRYVEYAATSYGSTSCRCPFQQLCLLESCSFFGPLSIQNPYVKCQSVAKSVDSRGLQPLRIGNKHIHLANRDAWVPIDNRRLQPKIVYPASSASRTF